MNNLKKDTCTDVQEFSDIEISEDSLSHENLVKLMEREQHKLEISSRLEDIEEESSEHSQVHTTTLSSINETSKISQVSDVEKTVPNDNPDESNLDLAGELKQKLQNANSIQNLDGSNLNLADNQVFEDFKKQVQVQPAEILKTEMEQQPKKKVKILKKVVRRVSNKQPKVFPPAIKERDPVKPKPKPIARDPVKNTARDKREEVSEKSKSKPKSVIQVDIPEAVDVKNQPKELSLEVKKQFSMADKSQHISLTKQKSSSNLHTDLETKLSFPDQLNDEITPPKIPIRSANQKRKSIDSNVIATLPKISVTRNGEKQEKKDVEQMPEMKPSCDQISAQQLKAKNESPKPHTSLHEGLKKIVVPDQPQNIVSPDQINNQLSTHLNNNPNAMDKLVLAFKGDPFYLLL